MPSPLRASSPSPMPATSFFLTELVKVFKASVNGIMALVMLTIVLFNSATVLLPSVTLPVLPVMANCSDRLSAWPAVALPTNLDNPEPKSIGTFPPFKGITASVPCSMAK